jgi:hypothetical protein
LLEEPIEIAEPVQPFGLNNHPEAGISQKRAARRSSFLIGTVDGDDDFEILKGLTLQTIERLGDVLHALIDRYPDGDARTRQALLLLLGAWACAEN